MARSIGLASDDRTEGATMDESTKPVPPPPAVPATPPRSAAGIAPAAPGDGFNRLGLAAFVSSILGLSCVPVVGSIAGLVLGIVAARREPRGYAIAGIALSAAGTCVVVPFLVALVLPALVVARDASRSIHTQVAFLETEALARQFMADNGRAPDDADDCFGLAMPPLDAWGSNVRLVWRDADGAPVAGTDPRRAVLFVESAGADGEWDTDDDLGAAIQFDDGQSGGAAPGPQAGSDDLGETEERDPPIDAGASTAEKQNGPAR
jgi:hypothetical protein